MSFNSIKDAVSKFYSDDNEIMFIHIREPEEIKRAVNSFNAKTLLIKRDGQEIIKTNYSDANVENYNYDYIIENTTLADLDLQANKLCNMIIKN